MFVFEEQLLSSLDEHDAIVRSCVSGEISFPEFLERYDNFYNRCALDGHESSHSELLLLRKHVLRIEPHRVIAIEILGAVCSDKDAELDGYRRAGRIGPQEALVRLRDVLLSSGSA